MYILWIVVAAFGITAAALLITGIKAPQFVTDSSGRDREDPRPLTFLIAGFLCATVFVILGLIVGWKQAMPEYRLWQATVEKRILVETATAEADAAVEQARGEVERAKGTAEANHIVAGSITEPYLRYLYINSIMHTDNQVIYVPTEAGLPILEAGKR